MKTKGLGKRTAAAVLTTALATSMLAAPLSGCRSAEAEDELFEEAGEIVEYATYGDTFVVDDMEITLGSNVTMVTPVGNTNQYSTDYGSENIYLKLPVTITNKSQEKQAFNISACTFYDNTGIEFSYPISILGSTTVMSDGSVSSDDITQVGNMRKDATIDTFFYLLYNGNGNYYIDFSGGMSGTLTEVELPVNFIESEISKVEETTENADGETSESETPSQGEGENATEEGVDQDANSEAAEQEAL